MQSSRFQELRKLFEQAVVLDEDERGVLLDGVREEDPELARDVVQLLERDAAARRTIEGGIADLVSSHPGYRDVLERMRDELAQARPSLELGGGEAPEPETPEMLRRIAERGQASERYRVESEVARGGMGAILRVWDEDLNRPLAMKVQLDTKVDATTRQRLLGRFIEEAQVMGQLDHPGIVPVHELGIDSEGRVYFTMKLVQGRDLKEIFRLVQAGEEGWTTTRAVRAVHRVCEAMAYAHDRGVIHRDLKPANVMVGSFGETYVMDWGLARARGDDPQQDQEPGRPPEVEGGLQLDQGTPGLQLTREGDVLGTPAYMPLEQAYGRTAELGPQADVYAVGAILYQLFAGHAPFGDSAVQGAGQVLQALVAGPPTPLHEVAPQAPAELHAIVEKAMARSAAERYPDMSGLAADLEAWLEGRVVSAYETGAWAEAKKWVKRNRGLAGALAGGLVIALGGLGGVSYSEAKGRRLADAERKVAVSERNNVLRLSAFQRLEDLEAEAESLWPARPEMLPRFDEWLDQARRFVAGLEPDPLDPSNRGHRIQLEELLARRAPSESGGWRHPDEQSRWWGAQLEKLIGRMDAFAHPETGLMGPGISAARGGWGVQRRRDWAAGLHEQTVNGPEARALWDEALASIGNPDECPKYEGLQLGPQLGLLPIGRDARSGLWEFADLQTGERPGRDSDDELIVTESMGVVFVLVPGGRFTMGAQAEDPGAPDFDRSARPQHEMPAHEVELQPFFVSKYEMTQGQWLRLAGVNPSRYAPGSDRDLTHPVERVSWIDCMQLLPRHGLRLPSEAEWEYAARAGTRTCWWSGNERDSLTGAVNLADQTAARGDAPWPAIQSWLELDDGFREHAPVGTFRASPFGLHEVYGNITELCLDEYVPGYYARSGSLSIDPVANEGEDLERDFRVTRGGSYYNDHATASSAFRTTYAASYSGAMLGLRPARSIE